MDNARITRIVSAYWDAAYTASKSRPTRKIETVIVFEIRLTSSREYHFRLLDTSNNCVILSGSRYTTKNACREGIDFVKNNAPYDYQYEKNESAGEFYFDLKSSQGKAVGTSKRYSTASAYEDALTLVKMFATRAPVRDLT